MNASICKYRELMIMEWCSNWWITLISICTLHQFVSTEVSMEMMQEIIPVFASACFPLFITLDYYMQTMELMIVWYKHTTVNLYYIYVLMAFPTKIEQCSCKIQNHQRTIVLNKNSFKVLIRLHIIPSCTMGKQCDKYNDYLSEVVQFCGFKCHVGTDLGHFLVCTQSCPHLSQ